MTNIDYNTVAPYYLYSAFIGYFMLASYDRGINYIFLVTYSQAHNIISMFSMNFCITN